MYQISTGDPVEVSTFGLLSGPQEPTCPLGSLERSLFTEAIAGGVLSPTSLTTMFHCDGLDNFFRSPEFLERVRAMADSGDPMAHAALGLVSEQTEPRIEEAIMHYSVASLLLHNLVKP
jgi:hypothetical protein